MDRFFKMFSKGKNDEPKAKEEEDLVVNNQKIQFEVRQMKKEEILEKLVKDLKIGGKQVDSYENYIKNLDGLLSQYRGDKTELEYRYTKVVGKSELQIEPRKNTLIIKLQIPTR